MPFNWPTFRTRALTAIVFVAVMAVGLLWNKWSFAVLFLIVQIGAWLEYQKLVEKFNPSYSKLSKLHKYAFIFAGSCLVLFLSNHELRIGTINFTDIGFWGIVAFAVFLPVIMLMEGTALFIRNVAYSIFGLIYISLPLALLVEMRTHWNEDLYQFSLVMPLMIIFSLWINDTMAYIVGSLIGKRPLSKVSPKKTWEGTIGGVLLTVLVISSVAYFTNSDVAFAATLSALASISGTFGDLFESKLKRLAGVKDSGNIMPGHGGFLDRFDSLLFASTTVWIVFHLLG